MISRTLELSLNFAVKTAQEHGHEYVGVEHILYALLKNPEASRAIRACGGSLDKAKSDIENFFNTRLECNLLGKDVAPKPTLGFQRVLQIAAQHVIAAGKEQIGGDVVLVSIYSEKESFAVYFLESQNVFRYDVVRFLSHGEEQSEEIEAEDEQSHLNQLRDEGKAKAEDGQTSSQTKKRNDFISLFTINLCEKAKEGKIDPLIGRSAELERTIQVLCRRRKNNPLYVGDSGVGKTALAEGLAKKIVDGEVPEVLKDFEIFALDLGSLLAGTKFRGDFEQRLKGLIKQIKAKEKAILFIDEIHTIVGAGAVSGGSLDASNILKPFLSSGEIRCIGSTTFKEFRQHIEHDPALSRRFQRISVDEPSVEDTIKILKGLKGVYETFHHVQYSADAIKAAAELSALHLKDKKLPDKAIDVLDESGAQLVSKGLINKDAEKIMVVGTQHIRRVIAQMAKIPLERLSTSDRNNLKNLADVLKKNVFGQDQAVEVLERSILLSRSGLGRDDKPIGSFLFSGPTGVGKTEMAKQLALVLGIPFIRFDMSEYMERHAVSRLIGAPPGYVGYDEGGLLTDKVHQNPHCVLLLDEIEKAHPDVHNILLQVMDHGILTDNNGRQTNFSNTVVILTTNVGAFEMSKGTIGFSQQDMNESKNMAAIERAFSPEFRNRLDAIITFKPLPKETILKVVDKFLSDVSGKLLAKRVKLHLSQAAKEYLAEHGFDIKFGARPLARLIDEKIKKPLVDELLFGKLVKGGRVDIDIDNSDKTKLAFVFTARIQEPAFV